MNNYLHGKPAAYWVDYYDNYKSKALAQISNLAYASACREAIEEKSAEENNFTKKIEGIVDNVVVISTLKKNIEDCDEKKERLKHKINELRSQYNSGKINYAKYELLLNHYLHGKPATYWIDYYNNYKSKMFEHISNLSYASACRKAIEEKPAEENDITKKIEDIDEVVGELETIIKKDKKVHALSFDGRTLAVFLILLLLVPGTILMYGYITNNNENVAVFISEEYSKEVSFVGVSGELVNTEIRTTKKPFLRNILKTFGNIGDSITGYTVNLIENTTEQNLTVNNSIENITVAANETLNESNITPPENITGNTNLTLSTENIIVDETITQLQAEINKPVGWIKKFRLNQSNDTLTIQLPAKASDIKARRIIGNNTEEITKIKKMEGDLLIPIDSVSENISEIILEELIDEVEIEYYTPAPNVAENLLNNHRKQVTISSEMHYENIVTYTDIEEITTNNDEIKLYWFVNDTKQLVEKINYIDSDNNGYIDRLQWITPHLSNQTYEVQITVLNLQSYPTIGGNWTVIFNTIGQANLTINTIDGTTWSNYSDTGFDLKFLELKCGNITKEYNWDNNHVFIENYSCNETSYEVSKVITSGKHHLQLDFGGQKAFASNLATGRYQLFLNSSNVSGTSNCAVGTKGMDTTVLGAMVETDPGTFTSNGPGSADAGQWLPGNVSIGNSTSSIELYGVGQTARNSQSFGSGWLYSQDLAGYNMSAGNFTIMLTLQGLAATNSEIEMIMARASIVTCSGNQFTIVKDLFLTGITGSGSNTVGQAGWRAQEDASFTHPGVAVLVNVTVNVTSNASYVFNSGERLFIELGFGNAGDPTARAIGLMYNFKGGPASYILTPPINLANPDYPTFTNFRVNDTLLKLNEIARFNMSVTDATETIGFANGTINGTNVTFSAGTGNEWYNDTKCTTSGNLNFSAAWANDTGNPINSNTTAIIDISAICDAGVPSITNAKINATSSVAINTLVTVNATITDPESRLQSVILEIRPPVSPAYNVTPTQSGDEFFNNTINLTEAGQWVFRFYANDTFGNINNTLAVDGASNQYIEVAADTTAPVIYAFSTIQSQSVTESSFTDVSFIVSVLDVNGIDTIRNSSAMNASAKFPGATTRTNLSCERITNINATAANYSCTTRMWYWDIAGDWIINVSVNDTSGLVANTKNTTFTLGTTTAIVMAPNTLTWSTLLSTQTNQTPTNTPLVINNTANKNLTNFNITAINLQGITDTSKILNASDFSANYTTGGSPAFECGGYVLKNQTAATDVTAITGMRIDPNNNTAGYGNSTIYICMLRVTYLASPQDYSTSNVGRWTVTVG